MQLRIQIAQINNLFSRMRHDLSLSTKDYIKHKEVLSSSQDPAYYLRILNERIFDKFITIGEIWSQIEFPKPTPQELERLTFLKSQTLEIIDLLSLNPDNYSESLLSDTSLKLFNLVHFMGEVEPLVKIFFEDIANELSKKEMLKIKKALDFSNQEYLFHGTKLEYVKETLERGSILGYTGQRYWPDGKRRKEKDPDYEDSFWMKGISMTRDINYAISWGSVTLIFDRKEILKKHEIQSYAWNYLFNHSTDNKKEAEDFVVLNKTGKRFKKNERDEFLKEYDEAMKYPDDEEGIEIKNYYKKEYDKFDLHAFKEPHGEFVFKDALKGFIIKGSTLDIFGLENETIQFLINHPLFLGIIENPNKPFA